jgi:hypothetical protein
MATATPPRLAAFDRTATSRRVRHPLDAIRGYIRRYVVSEGLAVALLAMAVCFWVWLALDYLPWTVFSFDWLWSTGEKAGVGTTVGLRVVLLLLLLGGLAALIYFKVIGRLFREFSDAAVALLLERRYPRQLGDRLITAVELADPGVAKKYGYSQAMIDNTIQDAAERVEKLPVQEIFRWGRLRLLWVLGVCASIGALLIVGVAYCAFTQSGPGTFFHRFRHTSGIWAERNLLMQSSYWPTTTLIELVRFPKDRTLRVPRDEVDARPDVIVRAVKYAVYDPSEAPRGWRALRVSDLEKLVPDEYKAITLSDDWPGWVVDMDDLAADVPNYVIPASWNWQGRTAGYIRGELQKPKVQEEIASNAGRPGDADTRNPIHEMLKWRKWTVDRLEQQLTMYDAQVLTKVTEDVGVAGLVAGAAALDQRERPVHNKMRDSDPQQLEAFKNLLSKLEALAAEPSMGRTLRIMKTPSSVTAYTKSDDSSGKADCKAATNGKYLFRLADLKKGCTFVVSSDDFTTAEGKVELVAPPDVERLLIDKDEPAYLYYRLFSDPDALTQPGVGPLGLRSWYWRLHGSPEFLKDKWQRSRGVPVSVTGPRSNIAVPFGSRVVLTASVDRKVREAVFADVPTDKNRKDTPGLRPKKGEAGCDITLSPDGKTITITLGQVMDTLEFLLEYRDGEFVRGTRHIRVNVLTDQTPSVRDLTFAVTPRLATPSDRANEFLTDRVYVITPDAFLKLRGLVEDDHGLTTIRYHWDVREVPTQTFNAKPSGDGDTEPKLPEAPQEEQKRDPVNEAKAIMAGFQFVPGPGGITYGYFAAGYYGLIQDLYLAGTVKTPYKATARMDLARARMVLNPGEESKQLLEIFATLLGLPTGKEFDEWWESKRKAEVERLLHLAPNHRAVLLDALKLDVRDTETVKKFADGLKTGHPGFLRELMDYEGLAGDALTKMEQQAASDPAGALVKLLEPLTRSPEVLAANRQLLTRYADATPPAKYELQKEDAIVNGFDLMFLRHGIGLQEAKDLLDFQLLQIQNGAKASPYAAERRWRFLKAPLRGQGEAAAYHLGARLTIEVSDNNAYTGPGRTTAKFPYAFVIVSENELLALMLEDQKNHYQTMVKVVENLQEKYETLVRQTENYAKVGNPFMLVGPLEKARQDLMESGTAVKIIRNAYEEIIKEMDMNRMKKERITTTRAKILDPLRAVTAEEVGDFANVLALTQKALNGVEPDADKYMKAGLPNKDNPSLVKDLDSRKEAHIKSAQKAASRLQALIERLKVVKDAMEIEVNAGQLLAGIIEIEQAQRAILDRLQVYRKKVYDQSINDLK